MTMSMTKYGAVPEEISKTAQRDEKIVVKPRVEATPEHVAQGEVCVDPDVKRIRDRATK